MADKRDQWAESFSAEPQGGWMTGFLAEEDKGVRRLMWRLGSWGVAAVGAVTLAVLAGQYEIQLRHDHFAAADAFGRQEKQLQQLTREAQAENRRLSQAIDTLNGDRDRLFTRLTSVEKGLESATGSILARQTLPYIPPKEPPPQIAAPATQPAPPPAVEPKIASNPVDLPRVPVKPTENAPGDIATKPAVDAAASNQPAAAIDQAAAKSDVMTVVSPSPSTAEPQALASKPPETPPAIQLAASAPSPVEVATPVARTEFGVDIGTANSIDGLRALWQSLSKAPALTGLRPIIVVRERSNGLGMQLRLVAGPLTDAAAAARICANLVENKRTCETSVFDGQRLALKNDASATEKPAATPTAPTPRPQRPAQNQRRAAPKPESAPAAAPKPEQRSEEPLPKPVEEAQAQAPAPRPSLLTTLGFSRE